VDRPDMPEARHLLVTASNAKTFWDRPQLKDLLVATRTWRSTNPQCEEDRLEDFILVLLCTACNSAITRRATSEVAPFDFDMVWLVLIYASRMYQNLEECCMEGF
jgi:hypothetical protein